MDLKARNTTGSRCGLMFSELQLNCQCHCCPVGALVWRPPCDVKEDAIICLPACLFAWFVCMTACMNQSDCPALGRREALVQIELRG